MDRKQQNMIAALRGYGSKMQCLAERVTGRMAFYESEYHLEMQDVYMDAKIIFLGIVSDKDRRSRYYEEL